MFLNPALPAFLYRLHLLHEVPRKITCMSQVVAATDKLSSNALDDIVGSVIK